MKSVNFHPIIAPQIPIHFTEKMADVHFTTTPCEPNTADRLIESHILGKLRPCTNKIVYARFKVFRTFRCVCMSVFRDFVRYELWVNLPVAIFFGTVDYITLSRKSELSYNRKRKIS